MGIMFVWVIVVIILLARTLSNAQKNERSKPRPNVPRQYQQTGRPSQPQKRQRTFSQQPDKRQPQTTRWSRQSAQQPQVNEILEKAKENSNYSRMKEEPAHELHGSDHMADHATELSNVPGVDDFDTYHLMDEVNDLIVKGYDGNLVFERDFLAEATDMLNRMIEMP